MADRVPDYPLVVQHRQSVGVCSDRRQSGGIFGDHPDRSGYPVVTLRTWWCRRDCNVGYRPDSWHRVAVVLTACVIRQFPATPSRSRTVNAEIFHLIFKDAYTNHVNRLVQLDTAIDS